MPDWGHRFSHGHAITDTNSTLSAEYAAQSILRHDCGKRTRPPFSQGRKSGFELEERHRLPH